MSDEETCGMNAGAPLWCGWHTSDNSCYCYPDGTPTIYSIAQLPKQPVKMSVQSLQSLPEPKPSAAEILQPSILDYIPDAFKGYIPNALKGNPAAIIVLFIVVLYLVLRR